MTDARGPATDLSPRDAAFLTGLSRSLIYREVERGHLRAYKVGGRLRITREALADWKRLHAVLARPHPPDYEPPLVKRSSRGRADFASDLRALRDRRQA